ncbi:cation transporter [Allobaculum stercoricanis]|uniref:cation transporter n=1 Tax=Allobaculum stercoricanis TaxID=174709 RepID=UPI000363CF5B|nr:cation transporter [Allobaculum stercoricanis]
MKKTYEIEVDCPVCAGKLEKCALATEGVESCSVNVMTQKLVIEAEADAQDKIIHEIAEKMKKIDDDIVIHI